ncbi:MAG: class I SAM-dependent methyltransferase [Candidatus Jordarchaeaceae archaeon]
MRKIIELGYKILNSKYYSKLFSSYNITWELAALTKSTAMDAILRSVKSEEEFWSSGREEAEKLKIFVDKNSVVLDVGCGMGRIEKFLAKYCKEIHAVDVSGRMIKLAKKNLKDIKNVFFYKNNGKDLSIFRDNMFDFAFSILTLQHLEKEDAYISL